eukprot:CAMPEP_0183793520 /NCGR_PEP_ID=MMETSP0803_2-20130417/3261_1 /TAXON_ID=195967 /ORGANISM="Crustomastix stigmata, Strain CCMP3273" /LENGTH=188 /DNA_ID=CAMNT_0026037899 /DNA_START=110 /DNA_END=673 /DNA_ORIENTATION=-
MLVPKKNRVEVYKYLFKEGVLYAKKDYSMPKHPEIDVPNLHVIKLMQSFTSKEFVKEQYAWQHYYWMLTDEGIEHLRQYLNIPADVVPATLKKSTARRLQAARAPRRPAATARAASATAATAAGTAAAATRAARRASTSRASVVASGAAARPSERGVASCCTLRAGAPPRDLSQPAVTRTRERPARRG